MNQNQIEVKARRSKPSAIAANAISDPYDNRRTTSNPPPLAWGDVSRSTRMRIMAATSGVSQGA